MVLIAVSGQPGAGSTTVGKALAEKLGVSYFSPGRLFKDIAEGKAKEQHYYSLFKELCDARGLKIPDMSAADDSHATNDFWDTPLGKSEELHNILDDLQKKLAETGDLVLDGKLSLRMIEKADLKVWLKASADERARRSAERDKIPFEEAKKVLLARQAKERKEWYSIYGFDYWDQEEDADLVIDTTEILPEKIVEKIVSALNVQSSRH
jgi:cytidylate kinase